MPYATITREGSGRSVLARIVDQFRAFWLGEKMSSDPTAAAYFGGGSPSHAGIVVNEYTALNYSAYWAGVQLIAGSMASLPLLHYKRLSDGGKERYTTSRVYRLLHDNFSPQHTSMIARETMQAHVLTWGNAYAEIERNQMGEPIALWPLTPDTVRPEYDASGNVVYRVRQQSGLDVLLPAADMLHIPGLGFDGLMGYSVVRKARESIGLGMASEQFGATFFSNGAWPGIVAQHPGKLTKEAHARLKDSLNEALQGGKPHSLIVTEEGIKVDKMGIPPDDAQFLQTREFQIQEIARWLNLPPHKLRDLTHATFCLPAETQVFTEVGPRSIADVKIGDRVWSRTDHATWELAPVTASACTGVDEILEIRAGLRTLRCNARHRVPVRRKRLEPWTGGAGRSITVDGQRFRKAWTTEMIPAGEIRVGDQLLAANGFDAEGGTACPTRDVCMPAFMEALGMIIGDGFYARSAKGSRTGTTVGISHGERDSYLPHYVAAIESEFLAGDLPYALKNGGRAPLKAARRDKNTTVFYSSPMYAELEACGIVGTAKTKRLPSWIFALSDELKLAFLRGYLDADGTVTKTGAIRYVSVNRELLEQVRHLCISVGIPCGHLISTEIASTFGGGKQYRHTLYALVCSRARENERIGSHTDFYRARWTARIASRHVRQCLMYPFEAKQRATESGVLFTRVESIHVERIHQPVYNLTVAGNHTFIADGVLVCNSNIEEQNIEFVVDTLRPWLVRWEQELNRKLIRPLEQTLQFTEHLVDGLLRGASEKRAAYYVSAINWGWMSPNDVRRLENMNPIQDGDVYLVPLNMQPASMVLDMAQAQMDKLTAPPPAPALPSPAEDTTEADAERASRHRAEMITAHRALAVEVFGRMVRRETAALRRVVKHGPDALRSWITDFYPEHEATVTAAILPAVRAHVLALERQEDPAQLAGLLAAEFVREHRDRLNALLRTRPANLGALVDLAADTWDIERPAAMADQLMTEDLHHALTA